MQYLVSVIDDTPDFEIDPDVGTATSTEAAAIDVYNDRLKADGNWVFAAGLASPTSATVIDNRGGEAVFTDGPFIESRSTSPASGSSRRPSRRGPQVRRGRVRELQSEGRAPAVFRGTVIDVEEAITSTHHEEWAGWSPP